MSRGLGDVYKRQSVIFAKRAAEDIAKKEKTRREGCPAVDWEAYGNLRKRQEEDKKAVRRKINGEDE